MESYGLYRKRSGTARVLFPRQRRLLFYAHKLTVWENT